MVNFDILDLIKNESKPNMTAPLATAIEG